MSMELHYPLAPVPMTDVALDGSTPSPRWIERVVTALAATIVVLLVSCSSVALALS